MYLAKQLTTRSLPEIGRKFGGRDHTTVMHAVRKIEELTASDRPSPRMSNCCAACCKAEPPEPRLQRAKAGAEAGGRFRAIMPLPSCRR